MDQEVRSQHNSQNKSNQGQSMKQVKKLQSLNIDQVKFQPPTKNPEEVFTKATPQPKVQNQNDMNDDNKSQTSQKSASSVQRKRKGSFIERMSQMQESEQERLNEKIKADLKAVFLENVDYKATKEELQLIFQDCAKIQRITILKNPYTNHPKGCAYISFETQEGVQRALNLSGVTLRNRIIKVHRKRTNVPGKNKSKKDQLGINFLGMMQNFGRGGHRGRGRGRGR